MYAFNSIVKIIGDNPKLFHEQGVTHVHSLIQQTLQNF